MQVIRASLFIADHSSTLGIMFLRFASQLYRHLGKNPLLDSSIKVYGHFLISSSSYANAAKKILSSWVGGILPVVVGGRGLRHGYQIDEISDMDFRHILAGSHWQ